MSAPPEGGPVRGPARMVRGGALPGLEHMETVFAWAEEGRASLLLEEVRYGGRRGALMCYDNPPVHQIGNPGLDAMLAGLAALEGRSDLGFLLLSWPSDPVHAGGDLKESLGRLGETEARRAELEAEGAPRAQIEALYGWADGRLDKGQALYRAMRRLGDSLRTVAVCGGGTRYGGSAEVNLMADWLVGDSRSAMCFSEAMIGLIPGWAGVARAVTKAGALNARLMAQAAREVRAEDLLDVAVYDAVVEIDEPLPTMGRTGDREADRRAYESELARHDARVWPRLVLTGLELATCDELALPHKPRGPDRRSLATAAEVRAELARRAEPETYREIWGRSLGQARDELRALGRPLAPQSVAELDALLGRAEAGELDEDGFVEAEKQADARLYRDPRLKRGIEATLEQRVADFRENTER